ncbi:MAG TPA: Hsp70 family protein [Solirubrobacteraceae bacterium]|nr:Hsp70 family protein [Solirubrobacteraceae bacterium]
MRPVGIDLGTTISLLASLEPDGRVTVLGTRDGGPRLRSVVHVDADAATIVGEQAERLALLDPDSVFALFKRSMGKQWSAAAGGRRWRPQDLSAVVLEALLDDAGASLGERPSSAVVTIPAYFGDHARRATLEAGELSSLDILALLHEPTAACIACRSLMQAQGTVLVYDLGGGTFDVSVMEFRGDSADVLATAGDHRLGGKDWDDVIVDLVAERLQERGVEDPRDDMALLGELQARARDAKHALSRIEKTAVTLQAGGRIERVELERAAFWRRAQPLFDRTEELVARVVDDVGGAGRIRHVLLAGGSTRMPPCGEIAFRATGCTPLAGVDADEAVARGAALFAGLLAERATAGRATGHTAIARVRDVTAHALGFVVISADGSRYVNEVMIPRNAPLPAHASKRHRLDPPRGRAPQMLAVHMLQGEAQRPLDTEALGKWTFTDIPGDPRDPIEVEVGYNYDANGVVRVTATIAGLELAAPTIDREDLDLRWTDEDPREQDSAADLVAVLTIDVSRSMKGEKLREAKAACLEFIAELDNAGLGDRTAVISFGSEAHTVVSIGDAPTHARAAVQRLAIAGSTNLAAGLAAAERQLAAHSGRRAVVVLTDGEPNDPDAALSARDRLAERDVEVIARGVAGADRVFLERLATGDGELVQSGQLGGNFRGIARQLVNAGAVGRG